MNWLQRISACAICALTLVVSVNAASTADTYPSKPITMIVPYPPGGATDTVARIVSNKLSKAFGQPVIVENKPGVGASIGSNAVAKAKPDGYTLLAGTTAGFAIGPKLADVPYDPKKDFTPIVMNGEAWQILAINPSIPANNIKEFVAYARANPGKLNFGSPGQGSYYHVLGEMFKSAAQVDIVHVPYRGSAQAVADLLAGTVQMMIDPITLPHVRSGKLKAIALANSERWSELPQTPTLDESGIVLGGSPVWWGILGPANMDKAVVDKINETVKGFLNDPDVLQAFDAIGVHSRYQSQAQFKARYDSDIEAFAKVIREKNIRAE